MLLKKFFTIIWTEGNSFDMLSVVIGELAEQVPAIESHIKVFVL